MKTVCEKCPTDKHFQEVTEVVVWRGVPAIEFRLACGHGVFVKVSEVTAETYNERYNRIHGVLPK